MKIEPLRCNELVLVTAEITRLSSGYLFMMQGRLVFRPVSECVSVEKDFHYYVCCSHKSSPSPEVILKWFYRLSLYTDCPFTQFQLEYAI